MAAATLHAAFGIPSQLETIGALAGLAAVLGLAVLSMLYFAQARELKRLREWAGRAPERAADMESRIAEQAQRRVQAQPVPGRAAQGGPQPARSPQPGQPSRTAPATAAAAAGAAGAAGAATATPPGQAPAGAQPQGQPGQPQPGQPQPGQPQPGQPQPGQPVAPAQPAKPGEPESGQPVPPDAPAQPGQPAKPAAPAPAQPRQAPRPTPAGQQTQVRAPGTAPRTPAGARRPAQPARAGSPSATMPPRGRGGAVAAGGGGGGSRRGWLLVLGAVVLVLAAGVFAFTQLSGGGDEPAPAPNTLGAEEPAEQQAPERSAPRSETTVAVLNGTTIPGLARSVADRIEGSGYRIGAVTNAPDQQRAATQVAYQPGNERAARAVAETIDAGADAVVPIDEVTSATAGDEAVVVVTVGADQSP